MNMKKYWIVLFCILLIQTTNAQKIAVVDTEYILQNLPTFKDAEKRLTAQIQQWQAEVADKEKELSKKKEALESEKVLLIDQQIKEKEKEISGLDDNLKKLLKSRFGAMGEMNTLRANLSKPFQDQIFNAIKIISEKNSLGIVLDKSINNVLFLDKKFDYTEKVLDLLKTKDNKNVPTNTNNDVGQQLTKEKKRQANQVTEKITNQ